MHLKGLEIFVLEEADRMLDMGFIHDIKRVVALLPKTRHSLFFSATMPDDIARLSSTILHKPVRVEVTPASTPIERIEQKLYMAEKADKMPLLRALLQDASVTKALVFSRTKHGANRICEHLQKAGIPSAAIHGNKSQTRRIEAMNGIADGTIRVLVATDIAARGIDVDGVSHVFNYDLPEISETYVHRIGRTARAGSDGIAISFCSMDERVDLRGIERLINRAIPRADAKPVIDSLVSNPTVKAYVPPHLQAAATAPAIRYGTGKKKRGPAGPRPTGTHMSGTSGGQRQSSPSRSGAPKPFGKSGGSGQRPQGRFSSGRQSDSPNR